jgi:hypothetical protein
MPEDPAETAEHELAKEQVDAQQKEDPKETEKNEDRKEQA